MRRDRRRRNAAVCAAIVGNPALFVWRASRQAGDRAGFAVVSRAGVRLATGCERRRARAVLPGDDLRARWRGRCVGLNNPVEGNCHVSLP